MRFETSPGGERGGDLELSMTRSYLAQIAYKQGLIDVVQLKSLDRTLKSWKRNTDLPEDGLLTILGSWFFELPQIQAGFDAFLKGRGESLSDSEKDRFETDFSFMLATDFGMQIFFDSPRNGWLLKKANDQIDRVVDTLILLDGVENKADLLPKHIHERWESIMVVVRAMDGARVSSDPSSGSSSAGGNAPTKPSSFAGFIDESEVISQDGVGFSWEAEILDPLDISAAWTSGYGPEFVAGAVFMIPTLGLSASAVTATAAP